MMKIFYDCDECKERVHDDDYEAEGFRPTKDGGDLCASCAERKPDLVQHPVSYSSKAKS